MIIFFPLFQLVKEMHNWIEWKESELTEEINDQSSIRDPAYIPVEETTERRWPHESKPIQNRASVWIWVTHVEYHWASIAPTLNIQGKTQAHSHNKYDSRPNRAHSLLIHLHPPDSPHWFDLHSICPFANPLVFL